MFLEGLKAYRKDGSINLFRVDQNAVGLRSAALLMPEFPEERFAEAVR